MKLFFSNSIAYVCLVTSLLTTGSVSQAQNLKSLKTSHNSVYLERTKAERNFHDNLTAFDPGSSNSIRSVRYREVVNAIEDFLALLDDEQRAAVVLPFDHPYRTRGFCYVLARCAEDNVGLRMSQLNARQKIALNNVLMKSYSSAGYSRAIQTMNREGILQEMEDAHRADPEKYRVVGSPLVPDWTPPPYRRSSDYYVAIFGQPAVATDNLTANPWGIRFEGHHLSSNFTFDGKAGRPKINAMPMFFGSSPTIVPQSPTPEAGEYPQWQTQEGQQLLHRETWLARSFLQSLDDKAIAKGAWSVLPDVALLGGTDVPLDAASYLDGEKQGIPVTDLSPLQQSLLWDFAREFWQMQGNKDKIDEYALKQSLNKSRVWWYGDRDDEHGELYFRVQSDRYLIELLQSNTFGVVSGDVEANHVHSSFRDLQNDWDRDSLGDHLRRHHVR